jgi:hypothetical protein
MGTPSPSPLPRPPFVMILDTYFLLFPTKRIIIYFIPTSCLQPKCNSSLASNKKDPWLLWKSNTSLFLPLFVFGDCMLLLTTSCLCAILGRGLGFRWGFPSSLFFGGGNCKVPTLKCKMSFYLWLIVTKFLPKKKSLLLVQRILGSKRRRDKSLKLYVMNHQIVISLHYMDPHYIALDCY